MKTEQFPRPDCGAADEIRKLAGAEGCAVGADCDALAAVLNALSDDSVRNELRNEFVKLTGASDCASLKGRRCGYYPRLAAELLRKASCRLFHR